MEGEGCFFLHWLKRADGTDYPGFRAICNMTDKDVILRLQATVGAGHVRGPLLKKTQLGTEGKPQWMWALGRKQGLEDFLRTLRPFMCQRRGEKIDQMLVLMTEYPERQWRHGRYAFETHQCRCDECREAFNAHHRAQRARRKARQAA